MSIPSEMMRRMLDRLLPDRNPDAERSLCRLGLHRWAAPGYPCRDCDMPDRLWQ